MASVGTSIVSPGSRPPAADTPGTSSPITTPQVTASLNDFAVSLAAERRRGNQYGLTFPILDHYGVLPWVPPSFREKGLATMARELQQDGPSGEDGERTLDTSYEIAIDDA